MYDGLNIYMSNNYIIHRCGEDDINLIFEILNLKNKKSYLRNSLLDNEYIKKLYIREKLFSYTGEFYILKNKFDEYLAIIGLNNVSNRFIYKYNISLLDIFNDIDENILINFINLCMKNIKNEVETRCLKFDLTVRSYKDNIDELINIFNKLLFENVGSFKNEFGKNIDLIVFEKKLI